MNKIELFKNIKEKIEIEGAPLIIRLIDPKGVDKELMQLLEELEEEGKIKCKIEKAMNYQKGEEEQSFPGPDAIDVEVELV